MSRHVIDDAIAEIRRLREINEELLAALKALVDVHSPAREEWTSESAYQQECDRIDRAAAAIQHADDQQG